MAGHSHWAGIKHKKAANDKKRGRLWSKLARNVIMAARNGGGDPDANLSLRYAIDKAKAANMPNDTIDRAIKKGTGDLDGASYEELMYEGYGPHGVAIMATALTDNRNRTAPEVKKIFESKGGSLGSTNSVAYMFSKRGLVTVPADSTDEDQLIEVALEAGADDVQRSGDVFEITCDPSNFEPLKQALTDAGVTTEVAELSMVPSNTVPLDLDAARSVLGLLEMLEDHEDIQDVYANFDVPDDVMAQLQDD